MNDERRDAAERWAVEQWGWMDEEDAPIRRALADGYLAGQECGEQRVTKRIMRWLQLDWTIWMADNAADAIIEGLMTEVWRGYDGEDE